MKLIFKMVFLMQMLSVLTACTVVQTSHDKQAISQYTHDAFITRRVKSKLVEDKKLKKFAISVSTNHNIVSLAGLLPNQNLKSYAIQLTSQVRGVQGVDADHLIIFSNMQ